MFLLRPSSNRDPTLAIWSPASEVVQYEIRDMAPYFFNRSPWVGTNREALDAMWADLYDFGTSGISPEEASNLFNATAVAPLAEDVYLIELQVIHDLHCLNMLRKVAYPDQYPDMIDHYENGTVNHDTTQGFHIDHCIDALRQSIQCTADVTPIKWQHHPDDDYHVFPLTWSTRTCRNFDAVRNWAKERQVPAWILDYGSKNQTRSS
ncbi:hypothetical protein JX265_008949 [Neoarthrinium moseri]|uniref:Tat pathway signal sequence n=1 Tax=Neoarthrinium moseri TaxID=1658444 RepID=A0A9P9WGS1_9PEZI|nr:hypothetical protein JX265_008949 [Neoarthrinium moseri]